MKHYLYTENFGKSILVRKDYFPKDTPVESLLLFAEMLNRTSESIADLTSSALANVSFSVVQYGEGYLLVGILTQVQNPNLHFAFQDPYEKARKDFLAFYQNGVLQEEEFFAQAKDHLLSLQETIDSKYGFSFSVPSFNRAVLPSLTWRNMDGIKEMLLKSQGSYLYFGSKGKKDPLLAFADKDIQKIEKGYKDDSSDPFVRIFSVPVIASYEDSLSTEEALLAYAFSLEQYYEKNYAALLSYSYYLLDEKHAALSFEVEKGDKDFLSSRYPSLLSKDIYPFVEKAGVEIEMEEIERSMSSLSSLQYALKLEAITGKVFADYFDKVDLQDDKAKEILNSLCLEKGGNI